MATAVSIVRMTVDPGALRFYASANRMLDDDGCYALHHAMRRCWGDLAPQPFHAVLGGPEPHVVGFVPSGTILDAPRDGDAMALAVFPGAPEIHAMPHAGMVGDELSFRLRVRPSVRYGREVADAIEARTGRRPPSELDVVAAERLRLGDGAEIDPAAACRTWLERRLEGAAELKGFCLLDRRLQRVVRSSHGRKGLVQVPGWTATMSGTLVVTGEEAFARLVATGVGRHAAFGYGMIMVSHSPSARLRAAA